jgi:probable F420-dependent oxidoreductase
MVEGRDPLIRRYTVDEESARLPEPASDISAYLIAGRVVSELPDGPRSQTAARTPAQGIQDGVDAEQIGFRRVFLSERYNLKEAGAFLGGVAARTSRLELGTGVITPWSRHPLLAAALGATMHACYGPRFILGLGRGMHVMTRGVRDTSFQALIDYARILKRLWAGETVSYDGPAGTYDAIALDDRYHGPAPQIWTANWGGPKACDAAADPAFDAVILSPFLTPDAVHAAATNVRTGCERRDRDPGTVRVCHPIVTAPDLDDDETRELAHARVVTYFQVQAATYIRQNGWDPEIVNSIVHHQQFAKLQRTTADQSFHRSELRGPAGLVPDSWMRESAAIGSVRDCVRTLRTFRDAGADEIITYGSTPAQNADLVAAWLASQHRAPEHAPA